MVVLMINKNTLNMLTYLYKYLDEDRSGAATSTQSNELFFVVTVWRGNGNISHRFATPLCVQRRAAM